MQIYFTEEELKFVIITTSNEYRLACSKDAPNKIKKNITEKISAHKKWLNNKGR